MGACAAAAKGAGLKAVGLLLLRRVAGCLGEKLAGWLACLLAGCWQEHAPVLRGGVEYTWLVASRRASFYLFIFLFK